MSWACSNAWPRLARVSPKVITSLDDPDGVGGARTL
jgi:hypothetical protein